MKVLLQFVFLVFYIASSYAITQERAALQLERSEQRLTGDISPIKPDCQDCHFAFPNFRQAKPKAGADAFFFSVEAVHLRLHTSDRTFLTQTIPFKTISTLENTHLRAPPIQL